MLKDNYGVHEVNLVILRFCSSYSILKIKSGSRIILKKPRCIIITSSAENELEHTVDTWNIKSKHSMHFGYHHLLHNNNIKNK
jgi:hypothetical protein